VGEVEATVTKALGHYQPQLMRVDVHLSDESSNKTSDSDKRCTLEARFAGLQPLAASGDGANLDQAVDAAIDRLTNLLEHRLGKLSEKKGRVSYGGEPA
jgi:ribosome-associated translation inhibitor RaiA